MVIRGRPEPSESVKRNRKSTASASSSSAGVRPYSRLAWVPVLTILLATVWFQLFPHEAVYRSGVLLTLLNLVFSTLIALLVSLLAAGTVLSGGPQPLLLLGAGMLVFGLVSILAGIVVPGGRHDAGIAIYNSGMLLSGLFSFAAGLELFLRIRRPLAMKSSGSRLLLVYGVSLFSVFLLLLIEHLGLLPLFFVEGTGPTPLRQFVLGSAVLTFAVSAVLILLSNRHLRTPFLHWYGLGLFLIAIGLWGVLGIRTLGGILAWTGRGAQYLGGLYLLAAVGIAVRDTGRLEISLETLQEVHQRYTSLVDTLPDAVIVLSHGLFVFANPAAVRLLGADSVKNLLGRKVMDRIHPESRATVARSIRELQLDSGRSPGESVPVKLLRFDGRAIEVESSGVRVDYEGRPSIQMVLHDVTERKRTERALRESERLFRTVIENSHDGINLLDLKTGRYRFVSPAQAELTGFSAEELSGFTAETAYERVHPDDRDLSVSQQKQVIEGPDSRAQVEYRWKVKSGEYRWFSDSRQVVRDEYGRAVALVGISRDITEQKEAERALRMSEERYRTLFESIDEGFCILEMLFDPDE